MERPLHELHLLHGSAVITLTGPTIPHTYLQAGAVTVEVHCQYGTAYRPESRVAHGPLPPTHPLARPTVLRKA